MATAARLPVNPEEYIGKGFHPDCDFVDGELQKRNLGELEHSEMQMAILMWFAKHNNAWRVRLFPEMRVQTTPHRFRVADIAVVANDAPRERILATPPLIVIEILSPEDRVGSYKERLHDYLTMGVRNLWVVDPMTLEGFDCSSGSWISTDTFTVPGTEIVLPLKQLGLPR